MFEHSIIQGRSIGQAELAQVREFLVGHPDWSRRRISERLARLWDWRNPAGQLKDMAARILLLKLEQRGLVQLPARRRVRGAPGNRCPYLDIINGKPCRKCRGVGRYTKIVLQTQFK